MGHSGGCGKRVEDTVDRALLRTLTFHKKRKKSSLTGDMFNSPNMSNSPPDSGVSGGARGDAKMKELHRLSWPGSSQPKFYLNPFACPYYWLPLVLISAEKVRTFPLHQECAVSRWGHSVLFNLQRNIPDSSGHRGKKVEQLMLLLYKSYDFWKAKKNLLLLYPKIPVIQNMKWEQSPHQLHPYYWSKSAELNTKFVLSKPFCRGKAPWCYWLAFWVLLYP